MSRYKHISQKPYCCVPACVQMILRRRGLRVSVSQARMAYELGIILSKNEKHLLPESHKGRKPRAGWGTRIHLKRYSLTSFFRRQGYALVDVFYSSAKFASADKLKIFLEKNLECGYDLLICFNYPALYGFAGAYGHASLVENVRGGSVILCDPDPGSKRAKTVTLKNLLSALKNHHKGGIWVIRDLSSE